MTESLAPLALLAQSCALQDASTPAAEQQLNTGYGSVTLPGPAHTEQ